MNPSLGMLVAAYDRQTENVGPLGDWLDTLSEVGQKVTKAAGEALSDEISPGTTQRDRMNNMPKAPQSPVPWGLIAGGAAVVVGLWWFMGRKKTA